MIKKPKMKRHYICPLVAVPENSARNFHVSGRDIIVWYQIGADKKDLRGFVNCCPHQGTPLETFRDRLLTRARTHLLCTTHGAQFDADGLCIKGPCRGAYLVALDIYVQNGRVYLEYSQEAS